MKAWGQVLTLASPQPLFFFPFEAELLVRRHGFDLKTRVLCPGELVDHQRVGSRQRLLHLRAVHGTGHDRGPRCGVGSYAPHVVVMVMCEDQVRNRNPRPPLLHLGQDRL